MDGLREPGRKRYKDSAAIRARLRQTAEFVSNA